MIKRMLPGTPAALLGFLLFLALPLRISAAAGEALYKVELIWGTDGEKPKDQPLKDVDPTLQERLKGVFKWKHYFEVSRRDVSLPKEAGQKLRLSDKCELQMRDLGNARIDVRLYGDGKLVVKKVQPVVAGELIVVGGQSPDATAWFVVLHPPK